MLSLRYAAAATLAAAVAVSGCRTLGNVLESAFRERPPSPLERLTTASDARIDSAGRLVGSFVGEGTSRAVHLISSDTALIAELVRRYSPRRAADPWEALGRAGTIRIPIRSGKEPVERGPLILSARVGSPEGRTGVEAAALIARAGRCGSRPERGAQAEIVVEPSRWSSGPELRGPVVGSLTVSGTPGGFIGRDELPPPPDSLADALVGRTRRAMDSTLAVRHRSVKAVRVPGGELELNTLADVDVADIVAYRVDEERIRYAVSLRERRLAGRDTLMAAGVMAWDEAGVWEQTIFRPTYLRLRRGRIEPYESGRAVFWRRLAAISDFGFDRDNLWMEQVDVRDGAVLWGIVQPSDNVVVAAAEMEGPCR